MKVVNQGWIARSLLVLHAAAAAPACGGDSSQTSSGDDCPVASQTECGASCVDTATDPKHCGSCSNDCTALPGAAGGSATCKDGVCVLGGCQEGKADCNSTASDGCETDTTTAKDCGACGAACMPPTPLCSKNPGTGEPTCVDNCPATTPTLCGTACVNTDTDPAHCGGCDMPCPAPPMGTPSCVGGMCDLICGAGTHLCGAVCADNKSPQTCGNSCVPCPTPANGSATCDGTSCGIACDPGYASNGMACVDINECVQNTDNCDPNATCTNTPGSFTCACNMGYTGNGVMCSDSDECAMNTDNCDPNATCTNTPGGFTCACKAGFAGNGVVCTDLDECAMNTDNCSPNASCTNTPGSFTCACNMGYAGNGVVCNDIDECAMNTDNCDPNATCTNTPGSFTCACNMGYTGNGVVCTDIDECAMNPSPCGPNSQCFNTPGDFYCQCIVPYQDCSGTCTDTNTDPSNCGQCGIGCGVNHVCVNGVCVGSGNLRVTLVWSRSGDLDLHVLTPNNMHIYYANKGPNANTDFGELDVDDTTKRGPENIFWDVALIPPTGTYSICVVPYSFTPDVTPADPVNFTVTIAMPGVPDQVFMGSRTTELATSVCTLMSPYYLTSFNYP